MSDTYILMAYYVHSCLEQARNQLSLVDGITVDNFRSHHANEGVCQGIFESALENFKYELSWNQMANGINLFLKSR